MLIIGPFEVHFYVAFYRFMRILFGKYLLLTDGSLSLVLLISTHWGCYCMRWIDFWREGRASGDVGMWVEKTWDYGDWKGVAARGSFGLRTEMDGWWLEPTEIYKRCDNESNFD